MTTPTCPKCLAADIVVFDRVRLRRHGVSGRAIGTVVSAPLRRTNPRHETYLLSHIVCNVRENDGDTWVFAYCELEKWYD